MDTGRFLVEVEQEIARLQQVASALRGLSGNSAVTNGNGRRPMSTAARRKISLAQKKRWSTSKANAQPATASPKRTISEAGRKRISLAQKKRWQALRSKAK